MVDQLNSFASEVTRVAREVGTEGKLGGQAQVRGVGGTWIVAARDLLTKAAEADPQYPLVHSALASAWGHLGYTAKARAEAQRAVELSAQLSQEERLLVEGQYQVTLSNWPKAVAAYQTLFNLFPDSLDYGLRLASVQQRVNPADALSTLAKLRKLPAPTGDDPRIDMSEASAWMNQDFVKAQAAAKRAIEKGTAQGSHLLVARDLRNPLPDFACRWHFPPKPFAIAPAHNRVTPWPETETMRRGR